MKKLKGTDVLKENTSNDEKSECTGEDKTNSDSKCKLLNSKIDESKDNVKFIDLTFEDDLEKDSSLVECKIVEKSPQRDSVSLSDKEPSRCGVTVQDELPSEEIRKLDLPAAADENQQEAVCPEEGTEGKTFLRYIFFYHCL